MNLNNPILIPSDPCPWDQDVYMGREMEFTTVGGRARSREALAAGIVRLAVRRLPHCRTLSENPVDFMTVYMRIYREMNEFVELASLTCRSSEALAWIHEAAFDALWDAVVTDQDRPVVLCHTPNDYNNHTATGDLVAHSTGCHLNMLSPRPLCPKDVMLLACLVSPLNVVFGPGGISWSAERPHFSCDPRADFVHVLQGRRAHGEPTKPFAFERDEPFASSPQERLQISGLGGPRSPISTWLQVELVQQAFRAVLTGTAPPWRVSKPLETLRARPDQLVRLSSPWKLITKASLAINTIDWLADFSASVTRDTDRVALTQELAKDAALAGVAATTSPVFPTDVAVKRCLFDRMAQMDGFASLNELLASSPEKQVLDKILLADIFFSTPNREFSTYEMACRGGLFVRPKFERPTHGPYVTLPDGVAKRDKVRTALIAQHRNRIEFCNWNQIVMTDNTQYHLPNPWSDIKLPLPVD